MITFAVMIELPRHIDLDNREFAQAFEILQNTDANVFLTGKAGTGKSTFLRYICRHLNKKYVVLAPTGVAAVNVGGVTIHSFFQMPLRPVPPDDKEYSYTALRKSSKLSRKKRKLISELDLIVIDEVSMVRPDMIDFIDRALRAVRGKRGVPFGGVQLLLVGDIFQLEPVVTSDAKAILTNYYSNFFFFNALAYQSANLVSIELKKIYRQTDANFIGLLDRVRVNAISSGDLNALNARVGMAHPASKGNAGKELGITLATRRDVAAMINKEKLDELPSDEIIFEGEVKDDFPEKILPTDLNLILKKDAQVMMIRNDKNRRWVNGTLARVVEISQKGIKIELEDGKCENVDRETWENISYEYDEEKKEVKENVIGTFTQYPLRTAWALTIHKSQGLTFNNVTIDMTGGAFSAGQTYVALSRCRSIEGLSFVNPIRKYDVIVSEGAADFSRQFNDESLIDRVLIESKVKALSKKSLTEFNAGNYGNAVEHAWEVHAISGAFGKKSVRRFLSHIISEIKTLKMELAQKTQILNDLSVDFIEIGRTFLDKDGNPEAALKYFKRAFELNDKSDEASYMMAVCHSELGDFKKSKTILDLLVRKKSKMSYDCQMLKGYINKRENNMSGAILNYLAAAKLNPDDDTPIRSIIEVYEKYGMDDLANEYRNFLEENF